MRPVIKVVGGIIGFVTLAILVVLRIALATVLAMIAPIVMPILALLSGSGLLVAIGFACAGQWHDAAKGMLACIICGFIYGVVACLIQIVNPYAFRAPVTVLSSEGRYGSSQR